MNGRARMRRSASTTRSIIFDGDDTLWMTQSIYKSVIEEFYLRLVQEGFNYDEVQAVFTGINESLLAKIKLSTDRYGRAMSATYTTLCRKNRRRCVRSISQEFIQLAQQLYQRTPEPFPHLDVIPRLAEEYELVFYSAGNEATQRHRLERLGLDKVFGERIHIVHQKDDVTLREILLLHHMVPESTWIVGNSPRFELNPGLRLGLRTIWMHTSFWKFDLEDVADAKTFVAFSLAEVRSIVLGGRGGVQEYQPAEAAAIELQTQLTQLAPDGNAWIVGMSPKLDLNPAISAGCNAVWIPTGFDVNDIEPLHGGVFVAFTAAGAEHIIRKHAGNPRGARSVIYRLRERQGDLGGSLVVD